MSVEGRTRKDILDAALRVGRIGAHIAPSLSLVEISLSVLKNSTSDDTIILSKGHGALGYYAAMHQMKMITDAQFQTFEMDGGEFPGQPSRSNDNSIDYSSGSLGMGLSYGLGIAVADRDRKVYVILGDGETNEGSIWETTPLAVKMKVGNLVVLVDQNGLQSDGECQEITGVNLEKVWRAYGWNTIVCDGHSMEELQGALEQIDANQPTVILAQTIKGKGISFMENDNKWHHHELSQQDYDLAVAELEDKYGFD
ncbi:MAG: 1-deoxy-D-xylulose-5-phosphate synthase N-terminal domain-containing protein [Clostridium sp.]|nr:1-deoxy-D-xylulose-5-phosphate synthase N-terminal domain-containing protein [Clostridium sp.]